MRCERSSSSSFVPAAPGAAHSFRLGDDDGNGTETDGAIIAGARASFRCCLRLFPLLLEDDFVLAIIIGGTGTEPAAAAVAALLGN
jgi:hypothetical protein